MIGGYKFGEIVVNGKRYRGDIKIIGGEVISGWWRKEGHVLSISDIEDIIAASPEVLVVGTGSAGNMKVDDDLRRHLAGRGIELIDEPTTSAVAVFNGLVLNPGRFGGKVAGAFHLTC